MTHTREADLPLPGYSYRKLPWRIENDLDQDRLPCFQSHFFLCVFFFQRVLNIFTIIKFIKNIYSLSLEDL